MAEIRAVLTTPEVPTLHTSMVDRLPSADGHGHPRCAAADPWPGRRLPVGRWTCRTAFGLGAAVAALVAGLVTDRLREGPAVPLIVVGCALFTAVVCLLAHRDEPVTIVPEQQ